MRYFIFALVIIAGAFALVSAVADANDVEAQWAVWVAIAAAALAFIAVLLKDVLQPMIDDLGRRRTRQVHAQAVRVDLSPEDAGGIGVSVTNQGTHVVKNIEVLAMPVGGDWDPMLQGPPFDAATHSPDTGVKFVPNPGGDVWFTLEQMIPDRGYGLGHFRRVPNAPTELRFQVRWLDHEGRRRTAVGVGRLDGDGYSEVQLKAMRETDK
jgi:hypothetical protein